MIKDGLMRKKNRNLITCVGFLGGAVVKNPPAKQEMKETLVRSRDHEDPLEKEMATHYSILA